MCTSAGTKAIFESVHIVGATIVVTGGANAIVSRCTILDCPVAILVHGARSHAVVRRCTARGCAAFVVATAGGSVQVKDSTVEMSDCGAVAVDIRGPGSHFQASDCNMKAAGQDAGARASNAVEQAGLGPGRGIRGRDGATIELIKYHVSGFMTGMDVCGAGSVVEARECRVHENTRAAIAVGKGAVAELAGCSVGRGGNQALVVRDLGTSVRADRCGFGGTTGDAIVATDGAGIRMTESNIAHVLQGCALAVSGTSSRVKCMECVIDDNEGGGVAVSARGSCVLNDCKILQSYGDGVSVSGVGSQVDLNSCQLERNASDGLSTTDGGIMTAIKCTVRQCGGSGLSVSGAGARMRATECLISESLLNSMCVTTGGVAWLQSCEVGPSTSGAGVHVSGDGSHADLELTNIDTEDGTVEAMDGASAEVIRCTLESGVRAGGLGTKMRLVECCVQGVSVLKEQGMLMAETCNFSVKPQLVPGEVSSRVQGADTDSEDTIQLTKGSTWQVEPLQGDELRMYVRDPAWNGAMDRTTAPVPGAGLSGAAPVPATGELAGLRERFWDSNAPRPSLEEVEAYHRAMLDELFSSQDSLEPPTVAASSTRAPTVPQASTSSGAQLLQAGTSTAASGPESMPGSTNAGAAAAAGTVAPMHASSSENSTHASRSRTFWRTNTGNRSNRLTAIMDAFAGNRSRPQHSHSTATGSSAAASSSTQAAAASAPRSSGSSTGQRSGGAHAIAGTSGTSYSAAAGASAIAMQHSGPVEAPSSAASLQQQSAAAAAATLDTLHTSTAFVHPPGDFAVPAQQPQRLAQPAVTGNRQQRHQLQRTPQLLTNYDSGAQPSTEGSGSAASTLNAPVHGAFLPPEDLADMHAGNFLGREPSRSSTQMSADAAQAETTLSPHVPNRPNARDRERSSREHREHSVVGHAGEPGAPSQVTTAQHTRRGAPSRRTHQSPQNTPPDADAGLDLLPRHTPLTVPPRSRSAAGPSSGSAPSISNAVAPSTQAHVQEEFLNMLDAGGSTSNMRRTHIHSHDQSSALTHSLHTEHAREQTAFASNTVAATASASTNIAQSVASAAVVPNAQGGQVQSAFQWLLRTSSRNSTPRHVVNQVDSTDAHSGTLLQLSKPHLTTHKC